MLSLYKMIGTVTSFYPEREIQFDDGVMKIRDFDVLSQCYNHFNNKKEDVEAHFTIRRMKEVRDLDKIEKGDTVEIYFTIRGYHWSGKDGVDGKFDDWVYNNLIVRRIRKLDLTKSDFDYDIEEWRRRQREEQENNEQ